MGSPRRFRRIGPIISQSVTQPVGRSVEGGSCDDMEAGWGRLLGRGSRGAVHTRARPVCGCLRPEGAAGDRGTGR